MLLVQRNSKEKESLVYNRMLFTLMYLEGRQ